MSSNKRPLTDLKPNCIEPKDIQIEMEIIKKEENIVCEDKIILQPKKQNKWKKLMVFIFSLIILTIIFWLILYSLAPTFVLKTGYNETDLTKVLLYSFIISFLLLSFLFLFYQCVH